MTVARDDAGPRVAGVVLAAGAGVRAGGPKALRRETSGPDSGRSWVEIAASSLVNAGCEPVVVVLGAAADEARSLVPEWARVVVCDEWAAGQSASLRAALEALEALESPGGGPTFDAALITLVDLPWQGAAEALAVVGLADASAPRASLARWMGADGAPGHPVLLGRDHWAPLKSTLSGDEGGRRYLADAAERGELRTASGPERHAGRI